MKLLSMFAIIFIIASTANAQKAKDVIEYGIRVKTGNKLFLRFKDNQLTYDLGINPNDYTSLEDSTIFLYQKNGANIYLRPLNPLKFSMKGENTIIIDPINEALVNSMQKVLDEIKKIQPASIVQVVKGNEKGDTKTVAVIDQCSKENVELYQSLSKKVNSDLSAAIGSTKIEELFTKLRNMPFLTQEATKTQITNYSSELDALKENYSAIQSSIDALSDVVENYDCTDKFVMQFIFRQQLKEINLIKDELNKRLKNLESAFTQVKDLYATATDEIDGMKWAVKFDLVPVIKNKISQYKMTIKESGLELANRQIVATKEKDVMTKVIRFRRFQRFVPEIAAGTAYTFFKYKQYGTQENAAGEQTVAFTGEKSISNLNFTTMVNFVYYTEDSDLHFLYQLGIGANTEVPTLFSGFGIRSSASGLKRIAITGGVAFTWVKELTNLSVGQKVSGTADIEKDLKHKFSWPPKPYIGLQYSF